MKRLKIDAFFFPESYTGRCIHYVQFLVTEAQREYNCNYNFPNRSSHPNRIQRPARSHYPYPKKNCSMSTLEAQLKWREQERKRGVYNTVGFIRNAPVIFMVREAA